MIMSCRLTQLCSKNKNVADRAEAGIEADNWTQQ